MSGQAIEARSQPRRESGVTFSALRTFVAVLEAGSISKAAAKFGVSQPTVSVQLNNLEQACGTPLLRRRPQIAPTEAGRELFIRARQIISKIDEFESLAQDLKGLERGRIALGTSTPIFAMPVLAAFMAARPAIRVQTTIGNTSSLLEDVAECRIDVGIMTLAQPPATLHTTLMAPQRLTLCVSRSDEWARKKAVHIAELADRPLIMRERGSMTRQLVESAFAERGASPSVQLEVGSREAVKEAVAAGIGVGVLLEGELGGDLRLAEVGLTGTSIVGGVYAVALKEAVEIPAVGAFLAHAASFKPLTSS